VRIGLFMKMNKTYTCPGLSWAMFLPLEGE